MQEKSSPLPEGGRGKKYRKKHSKKKLYRKKRSSRHSRRTSRRKTRQRRTKRRTKKYRSMRGGATDVYTECRRHSSVLPWVLRTEEGMKTRSWWSRKIMKSRKIELNTALSIAEGQLDALIILRDGGLQGSHKNFEKILPYLIDTIREYIKDATQREKVIGFESRDNYEIALTAIISYGLHPFKYYQWGPCLEVQDMPGDKPEWSKPERDHVFHKEKKEEEEEPLSE